MDCINWIIIYILYYLYVMVFYVVCLAAVLAAIRGNLFCGFVAVRARPESAIKSQRGYYRLYMRVQMMAKH